MSDWLEFYVVVVGSAIAVSIAYSLAGIRSSLERLERKLETIEEVRKSLDLGVKQLHRIASIEGGFWSRLKGIENALSDRRGHEADLSD